MIDLNNMPEELLVILKEKFGNKLEDIKIPPTAFTTMGGELVKYDLNNKSLESRFPVSNNFLNQFGNMNGGMIAAAIDNTFGPLSMLMAPPNFTRTLEVKFKKSIPVSIKHISVEAKVYKQDERQIFLTAKVFDIEGCVYATAKATHWIIS